MEKFIELTNEELLKVRGGFQTGIEANEYSGDTVFTKWADPGGVQRKIEIDRMEKLKKYQDAVREAAIYQPSAKGNFDYKDAAENVTWCNQSSYDVMEATGVHMEAFYGNPKGYKGKEGQRGAGYWVNANTACKNVENYIDTWAKNYSDNIILNKEKGINSKSYPVDASGELSKEALYAEGKANCPIQEITAEQAQALANRGYTVVVMWENPPQELPNGTIIQESGHISTVRPDLSKKMPTIDPKISNVGSTNELSAVSKSFGKGFKAGTVKYYYDRNQTFTENEGFKGPAYNSLTGKQSISINDPSYDENNYLNYKAREAEEDKHFKTIKSEINKEYLENHPELYNSDTKSLNFNNPFIMNELIKYGLNKAISSDTIDKNIKRLKEGFKIDNNTLLAVLKKNDKKIKDVLLGKIIAGDYIKQKKAEIVAREKAKAEEERKKKEAVEKEKKEIEEKAAKEKVEKERKAKEQKEKEIQARTEEDRKKKESSTGNNSSPIPNPDPPDSRVPIDIPEKDFNPPLQPPAPQPKPKEPPSVSRPAPPAPSPKPEQPAPKQAPDRPPKTGGGEKPGNGGGRGKSGGGGGRPRWPRYNEAVPLAHSDNDYYISPLVGTAVNARGIEASGTYQPSGNEINKLQNIINFNITSLQSQDITLNNKSYEW